MSSVLAMQHEGRELAREVRGGLPHLHLGAVRRRDEPGAQRVSLAPRVWRHETAVVWRHSLAVRRELDISHGLLKVEVVEDGRALEVDQYRSAVCRRKVLQFPRSDARSQNFD